MKRVVLAAVVAVAAGLLVSAPVEAQERRSGKVADTGGAHPASDYYRRSGPQVRGYVARKGGYSYNAADTINTYGDSRTLFGGASSYRDPALDRQTNSGPFDHGFFFDSGIRARGGDSPYIN